MRSNLPSPRAPTRFIGYFRRPDCRHGDAWNAHADRREPGQAVVIVIAGIVRFDIFDFTVTTCIRSGQRLPQLTVQALQKPFRLILLEWRYRQRAQSD